MHPPAATNQLIRAPSPRQMENKSEEKARLKQLKWVVHIYLETYLEEISKNVVRLTRMHR